MKPAFKFTLLISLLVHLLVIVPLWLLSEDRPEPYNPSPIEVVLQPQPEPATIQTQTHNAPPPPRHIEDDITKANTSDGVAEDIGKAKTKLPPKDPLPEATEHQEQLAKPQQEDTQPQLDPVVRSNSPTLSDYLKAKEQGTQNDQGLNIQTSQSAKAEERARWYNEVLKRIREQVLLVWVKPTHSNSNTWGIIHLKLNENGYLEDAWIHVPSGDAKLDRSALRALHQVYRYDIPHAKEMSQYYRHLEFRFHGGV